MLDDTPLSVPDVVRAFEERRTVTGSLSHREHVMIAWHYARTRPAPQALADLARGIQELAVALGKEGLYHETLTWGWFSLIRERMERMGVDATWEEFSTASEDILSGRAIHELYERATLDSDLARRVFLMPGRDTAGG
jgi:N-formylglutamate deformylase